MHMEHTLTHTYTTVHVKFYVTEIYKRLNKSLKDDSTKM